MKDVLEYRGFAGWVHYCAEDDTLYGKIEGITDLVSFDGRSVDELRKAFEKAVDDHIALCRRLVKEDEKIVPGTFNVRIPPELHLKAAEAAIRRGESLNQFAAQAIRNEVAQDESSRAAEQPPSYGPESEPGAGEPTDESPKH